jgi:hypothetical protein
MTDEIVWAKKKRNFSKRPGGWSLLSNGDSEETGCEGCPPLLLLSPIIWKNEKGANKYYKRE